MQSVKASTQFTTSSTILDRANNTSLSTKKAAKLALYLAAIGWFALEISDQVSTEGAACGLVALRSDNPALAVLGCGIALTGVLAQIVPISSVFRVNTNTANHQQHQAMSPLFGDEFMMTWTSSHGGVARIYGQQLENEVKIGGEVLVNSDVSGSQGASIVAGLEGGGFISGWMHQASNLREIAARKFNDSQTPLANQFRVNTVDGNTIRPAVAPLISGGSVFAWFTEEGIKGQPLHADGSKNGSELLIADSGLTADVAPRPNGGFFAVWDERDANGYEIFGRLYGSDMQPEGPKFQISDPTSDDHKTPRIKASNDTYMVIWNRVVFTFLDQVEEVLGQGMDDNGNRIGSGISIPLSSSYTEGEHLATDLTDGSWLIFYAGGGTNGDDIIGERYFQNGTQSNDSVIVGTPNTGSKHRPKTVSLSQNKVAVSWQEDDGDGSGIFAQLFQVNVSGISSSSGVETSTPAGSLSALGQSMPMIASSVSESSSMEVSQVEVSSPEFTTPPGVGGGINPLTVSSYIDSWELIDGAIHVTFPETLVLDEEIQITLFTFENEQTSLWENTLFINDSECFDDEGVFIEDNGDGTSSYNLLFGGSGNNCVLENDGSRLSSWKSALIGGVIKKWA